MSEAISIGQRAPENPPRVQLVKGQEVSLGCGTLILIAIIVMIFSGQGGNGNDTHRLQMEVANLKASVDTQTVQIANLKQSVEAQTAQIKALQDKLEAAKGKQ
jgi:hypothetical protein